MATKSGRSKSNCEGLPCERHPVENKPENPFAWSFVSYFVGWFPPSPLFQLLLGILRETGLSLAMNMKICSKSGAIVSSRREKPEHSAPHSASPTDHFQCRLALPKWRRAEKTSMASPSLPPAFPCQEAPLWLCLFCSSMIRLIKTSPWHRGAGKNANPKATSCRLGIQRPLSETSPSIQPLSKEAGN